MSQELEIDFKSPAYEIEIGVSNSTGTPASPATIRVDAVSDNLVYRGDALQVGANENETVWSIRRIEVNESGLTITWAGGSKAFNAKWSDRLTYVYSAAN